MNDSDLEALAEQIRDERNARIDAAIDADEAWEQMTAALFDFCETMQAAADGARRDETIRAKIAEAVGIGVERVSLPWHEKLDDEDLGRAGMEAAFVQLFGASRTRQTRGER